MSKNQPVYAIFDGLINATIWESKIEQDCCYTFTLGDSIEVEKGKHYSGTVYFVDDVDALLRVIKRTSDIIRRSHGAGEIVTTESRTNDFAGICRDRFIRRLGIKAWEGLDWVKTVQLSWGSYFNRSTTHASKKKPKMG